MNQAAGVDEMSLFKSAVGLKWTYEVRSAGGRTAVRPPLLVLGLIAEGVVKDGKVAGDLLGGIISNSGPTRDRSKCNTGGSSRMSLSGPRSFPGATG